MKSRFRQKLLLGLMLITALFSLVPTSVFAAGETAFLDLPSGTSQPGDTFPINVQGHVGATWWGGGVTSSSGTISYNPSLLKVIATPSTGSAFSTSNITTDASTGVITFKQSRSILTSPPANQTIHLFSITFQSLADGIAKVQFGTVTYSTGTATTTGGVYTIATPTPPPSPSPSPSPTPTPTKTTTKAAPVALPSPSPTPTPPDVENTPAPVVDSDGGLQIENVKVTATRSENSVAWTLNNATATPTLQFGTSKSSLDDAGAVSQLDDGSYKFTFKDLKPGTPYYFTIKASTADNLSGASYSGVLTTRGYPVQLKIKQNNLGLPGARVTLNGRSFVANSSGLVTTELGDGKFTASITPPGEDTSHSTSFTVKKVPIPANGNPATQDFTLNIMVLGESSGSNSSPSLSMIVGVGLAGVAVIGGAIGFLFFMRSRSQQLLQQTQQPSIDIDTSQLKEAYGANVEEYMTNTPTPNLDGDFATTPQMQQPGAVQMPSQPAQPVPVDPTLLPGQAAPTPQYEQPAVDMAVVATAQPTVTTFDPASLPLTPATATQQAAPVDMATQEPAVDENDAALSQELAQVESSEPTAIYDASTGELDIIHHHTQGGAA